MPSKEARVKELETLMEGESFWQDQEKAQKVIKECNEYKAWTLPYQDIKKRFEDVVSLLPDAFEAKEENLIDELTGELALIEKKLEELEMLKMLSGELDKNDCYIMINSGAGGTEACDWVQMLSRMYQRWGAKHNWNPEVVDFVEGDVAGLKSVAIKLTGKYAYGYAKAEKGVHRLIRISPFDSNAKRHTSFASVDVSPEISDDIQIEIKPDDIRIDTFRSSGAGGQHVNKTDSAVRITHFPSGVVVSCQSQRSQVQNKESCFKMLRGKLHELEVKRREEALNNMKGEKKEIAWGHQIRSYVFQPYTLVKDNRTNIETGNIQAVMDGDLDNFVYGFLKELGNG